MLPLAVVINSLSYINSAYQSYKEHSKPYKEDSFENKAASVDKLKSSVKKIEKIIEGLNTGSVVYNLSSTFGRESTDEANIEKINNNNKNNNNNNNNNNSNNQGFEKNNWSSI